MLYHYLGIYAVIHLTCLYLVIGLEFAYWQRKWPSLRAYQFHEDRRALLHPTIFFFAPLFLMLVPWTTGVEYGWLWPWSKQAYDEAGIPFEE